MYGVINRLHKSANEHEAFLTVVVIRDVFKGFFTLVTASFVSPALGPQSSPSQGLYSFQLNKRTNYDNIIFFDDAHKVAPVSGSRCTT